MLVCSYFNQRALKEDELISFKIPYIVKQSKSIPIFCLITMIILVLSLIFVNVFLFREVKLNHGLVVWVNVLHIILMLIHISSLIKYYTYYYEVNETYIIEHTLLKTRKMNIKDIKYQSTNSSTILYDTKNKVAFYISDVFVGITYLKKLLISNGSDSLNKNEIKEIEYNKKFIFNKLFFKKEIILSCIVIIIIFVVAVITLGLLNQ